MVKDERKGANEMTTVQEDTKMAYDLNALLQAAHQKVAEQIERLGYFSGVGVSSDDGRIHLSLSPKQGRADASRRLAPMKMWKLDGKRISFDNLKAAIAELQDAAANNATV